MERVRRYVLLVSTCAQTPDVLCQLLLNAGVIEPLKTVTSDVEAIATFHHPDREPPLAIFVDATITNRDRLISWIVSSPTTRLIPVFAIVNDERQSSDIQQYKPTAIIFHPLDLGGVSRCISMCPLLRPTPNPPQVRLLPESFVYPQSTRSGEVSE